MGTFSPIYPPLRVAVFPSLRLVEKFRKRSGEIPGDYGRIMPGGLGRRLAGGFPRLRSQFRSPAQLTLLLTGANLPGGKQPRRAEDV